MGLRACQCSILFTPALCHRIHRPDAEETSQSTIGMSSPSQKQHKQNHRIGICEGWIFPCRKQNRKLTQLIARRITNSSDQLQLAACKTVWKLVGGLACALPCAGSAMPK